MLRVGICDDEIQICANLEVIIQSHCDSVGLDVDIEQFFSGEALISQLSEENFYDIIFLDISLGEISGIDVGQKLRNDMNNQSTQIVYISNNEKYAMKLFSIRPINFLIKPLTSSMVVEALNIAIKIVSKINFYFEFSYDRITKRIPIDEILYFESTNKKIKITTINGNEEFYGTLGDVILKLRGRDFIRIHKSYLVNYNQITSLQYGEVTLSNGDTKVISQKRRKLIRDYQLKKQQER